MDQNHVLDAGWRRRSCGPLQQQNRAHQHSSERYKSVLFMALSIKVDVLLLWSATVHALIVAGTRPRGKYTIVVRASLKSG
jgi:hypothetical protein